MANLTQTAANVGLTSETDSQIQQVTYGEAVTQGMPVYLNTSDGEYYKADANASSTTAQAAGIALTPGGDGERGVIVTSSSGIDLGATLTVGTTYVVSATAGAIAPIADLTTNDYVTVLGTATAAGKLRLSIDITGAQKP